jgi:hypothetical protein
MTSRSPVAAPFHRACLVLIAAFVALHGPARAQSSSINLSRDLVALGIASANMVPNQPALDARPLWEAAIAYVRQNGVTSVTADPGAYYFLSTANSVHALLAQLRNVTIDLQGAELRFVDYRSFGIYVFNSTGVTLKNVTLDYLELPFTQVLVTGVDLASRAILYTLHPGRPSPQIFNDDPGAAGQVFVQIYRGGRPATNLTRMTTQLPFQADRIIVPDDGSPWQTASVLGRVTAGDTAVISNRLASLPVFCYYSSGMTFENIRIYSGGFAFMLSHTSNSLAKRVYTMPKPGTDRLISVVADGPTVEQPGPGNTFLLSRSIGTMDDGFSPHALIWGTVTSVVNSTTLQVRLMFPYFTFANSPVVFWRPDDSAPLLAAAIVSQGAAANGVVTIGFDRDVSGIPIGALMAPANASDRGSGTVIDRSAVMYQGFANGITLYGLTNSTVRRSYIRHSSYSAITIQHWTQPNIVWMTPPPSNVAIHNNVIDGAITTVGDNIGIFQRGAAVQNVAIGPGPQFGTGAQFLTTAPVQNITIRDNFIADPSRTAIKLQSVSGGAIEANLLVNPNNRSHPDGWDIDRTEPYRSQIETPIVVQSSTGVSATGNVLVSSPRRIIVTDTQFRHLAAYAPGSVVRLNASAIGAGGAPVATLRDANGADWPLTVANAAADYLDVILPNPAGADLTGGGYITVQRSEAMYGTLFLDTQDNIPALNGCVTFADQTLFRFGPGGGTGVVRVIGPGCSVAAQSNDTFVTITDGATGSAPSNLVFSVAATAAVGRRAGTITVNGEPITIEQVGWSNGAPGAPGAPMATGSGNALTMTWIEPSTEGGAPTAYTLVARLACRGPIVATVPVGNMNTISLTAPNGTFCVSVQASNASGAGPESPGTVFSVPLLPPPPGPPTNLTQDVRGTTVNFSWAAPASGGAVTQYWLIASVTPGGAPIATLPISGSVSATQVNDVPPGTYYVRAVAANAGGSSPASNEVTVVVAAPQPPRPPLLGAPAVTVNRLVTLAWTPGGGGAATLYTVRARFTSNGPIIASLPVSASVMTLSVTAPPGTFYVSVVASNAQGTSADSNQVVVRVP